MEALLRFKCHRTGKRCQQIQVPLYRIRWAPGQLWNDYRYHWRILLSHIIEANEYGTPGLSAGTTMHPCYTAHHVEGGSRGDMLEMRFLLSDGTRALQTHHPNPLRNSALNPGSPGVYLGKIPGLFLSSVDTESPML